MLSNYGFLHLLCLFWQFLVLVREKVYGQGSLLHVDGFLQNLYINLTSCYSKHFKDLSRLDNGLYLSVHVVHVCPLLGFEQFS